MPDRIVVDLGAATYGSEESIRTLVERYQPDRLYAFDPWPDFPEDRYLIGRTEIIQRRAAAWTSAGQYKLAIGSKRGGSHATMICANNETAQWTKEVLVTTFDLADFIERVGRDAEWLCLKMDVEGAEVELLEHLMEMSVDARLDALLVEWHEIPEVAARKNAILHELPWIEPWT